jgi:hypothetical protein
MTFRESQEALGHGLRLVLLGGVGLALAAGVHGMASSARPIGETILLLVVAGTLAGLFLTLGLTVEVNDRDILIDMRPVRKRTVPLRDVVEARALDHAHWYGMRMGFGAIPSRQAFLMTGNQAVELVLANGRRVLVGSRKPGALVAAIESRRRA